MHKKQLITLFFLFCTITYGQIGGQGVYKFLNLIPSPRQAALGGKTITNYDHDVNQAFFNPASINAQMDRHLSVNYGSQFGEISYGTAAFAYTLKDTLSTIHAGVNYINYGNFDGRDEIGNTTSSFSGSEAMVSVGYAKNIPNSDFYVGVNAKFISSTLETYKSSGAAIDLGLIYVNQDSKFNYGLSLRNLGTQFTTYAGTNEKLPFEIILGLSKELENLPLRWHLTLENLQQWEVSFSNPARSQTSIDGTTTPEKVSFFNNAFRHTIIGIEIFPKRSFNLRFGYNFRRGEELKLVEQRTFAGLSLGFGLRFNKIKLDYSYSRYTLAGNTNLFGLTINFGK